MLFFIETKYMEEPEEVHVEVEEVHVEVEEVREKTQKELGKQQCLNLWIKKIVRTLIDEAINNFNHYPVEP